MKSSAKSLAMSALFGRWPRLTRFEPGYTLLLPSPMDMPFLLRFALEGLRGMDTRRCRRILVIPDGWGADDGRGLREVVDSFDDPRLVFSPLRPVERLMIRMLGMANGSGTHWVMIVNGTSAARTEHVFLHDSDAFHLDGDGLERQYQECLDRGLDTLGVTARWDPFFADQGVTIPGTWEMMFSNRWARSYTPYDMKGRVRQTPAGPYTFDTMLYPQYLDAGKGRVGVMADPPRLVHFHGTIVTYRNYRDRGGRSIADELFRVLLLSVLENLIPPADGRRVTPPASELARGLTDPSAPVTYQTPVSVRQYPIFRKQIDELCEGPVFRGARADQLRELLRPFDEHFKDQVVAPGEGELTFRTHGLG